MAEHSEEIDSTIRELTRDEFVKIAGHLSVLTSSIPVALGHDVRDALDMFTLGLDEEELNALQQSVYEESYAAATALIDFVTAVWNGDTK